MKRHEPCAHLRPDYDRLEVAHHIVRDPVTDEVSWEPSSIEAELQRLGLVAYQPFIQRIPSREEKGATQ